MCMRSAHVPGGDPPPDRSGHRLALSRPSSPRHPCATMAAHAGAFAYLQVSQISRWEADFLQLLSFNTNVTVAQYAATCFDLQKAHEDLHGKPCHFFTYLMSLSTPATAA